MSDHVLGAGLDRGLHQRVLAHPRREQHLPAMLELERHAAVGAHVAAVLGKGVAHVGDGAGAVVGEAIDHHRGAADAVALVADLDVVDTLELAGALLDRAVDVVGRHVDVLGLVDRQTQARVEAGVAAAHLGGHCDLLGQPREDAAAFLILAPLAVLDVGPFAVSCHVSVLPCVGPDSG